MCLCVYCLHAFIAYVMRAIDTPLTYLLTYLQHLTVLLICGSWACSCFSTFCIWLDRLSQSTTCLWFVLHISICYMITFTSVTASLYFDCCSLLVPLRIGGWVGLGNVFQFPSVIWHCFRCHHPQCKGGELTCTVKHVDRMTLRILCNLTDRADQEPKTSPTYCPQNLRHGSNYNVLNVMCSSWHKISAVHLIETYFLPSLTYNCEIWSLREYDAKRVDAAWNNAFHKIFNSQ